MDPGSESDQEPMRHHVRPKRDNGKIRRDAPQRNRERRSGFCPLAGGNRAGTRQNSSIHPYVVSSPQQKASETLPSGEVELRKIFALVQRATGVDFTRYKQTTTRRRIGRRMIVHRSRNSR